MLEAGAVRAINVKNILLKNLLDACVTAVFYFFCGYAFQYGGGGGGNGDGGDEETATLATTFIGRTGFFLKGLTRASDYSNYFLSYGFAASSVTIVACAVAERCQFMAYIFYSILLSGFVYPVVARSMWTEYGFLSSAASDPFLGVGVVDFAGSGVVHLTGGATAFIACRLLGPRIGRFYDLQGEPLEKPVEFKPHSSALQVLGTMLLWFGW